MVCSLISLKFRCLVCIVLVVKVVMSLVMLVLFSFCGVGLVVWNGSGDGVMVV